MLRSAVRMPDQDWRGFIGTVDHGKVLRANGSVVWSQREYAFLDNEEPGPTVNPSQWRQARLNRHHGLFEFAAVWWRQGAGDAVRHRRTGECRSWRRRVSCTTRWPKT